MPRIYDKDHNPLDFCLKCWPDAEEKFGDDIEAEVDADHPPYSDTDYRCEVCKKQLTDQDN